MDIRAPWLFLLPALLAASWRVSNGFDKLSLDRLVEELAGAPLFPAVLRDPMTCRDLVDRLLPWLPPRGLRSCLKRSLLLMDLWSRCGLAPRFHLGLLDEGEARNGHAWVTVPGDEPLCSDPAPPSGIVLWESVPTK